MADVAADYVVAEPQFERAPQPIVIASLATQTPPEPTPVAVPVTTPPLRGTIAPLISSTPAPALAQFFTINKVMAKHTGREQEKGAGQYPARFCRSDGNADAAGQARSSGKDDKGQEPFGLFTFVAPDGVVWFKWRKVVDDIRAAGAGVAALHCRRRGVSPTAARFAVIVKEAREHEGRVRLNFVNQRVNYAIRYTSDMTQWGAPDEWSAPLAAGKGSFDTGLGDCEDYAIARICRAARRRHPSEAAARAAGARQYRAPRPRRARRKR